MKQDRAVSITARVLYFLMGMLLATALLTIETYVETQNRRVTAIEQYLQFLNQMMQQGHAQSQSAHPSLAQPAFRQNTTEAV